MFIFESIIVQIPRQSHILYAIFDDFIYLTTSPPFYGIQPISQLVPVQGRSTDAVKLETPSDHFLDITHQVDALYFAQISRIVFIQQGNVEVVAIPSNYGIGLFENRPEFAEV